MRSCSFYRLYVVTPEDTEDFEHEFPAIPTTYYEWIRPEFRATVLARPRTPDDLRRPRINQGTERVFAQVCALVCVRRCACTGVRGRCERPLDVLCAPVRAPVSACAVRLLWPNLHLAAALADRLRPRGCHWPH